MLYLILKHSHSTLRWLILAALLYGILQAFAAWKNRSSYTPKHRKFHLLGMTLAHIQLILGLLLYGLGWGSRIDFSRMKDATTRFYTVEHSLLMLIAIVLVSIGYSRAKRAASDQAAWKDIWLFWGAGLLLMLIAIPWPFRAALGAGWF